MNTEPKQNRSLEPQVDLRTIPSGWDLSGFYSPAERWVNEPQQVKPTSPSCTDPTQTSDDSREDAV